jgi:hypothetical protein
VTACAALRVLGIGQGQETLELETWHVATASIATAMAGAAGER